MAGQDWCFGCLSLKPELVQAHETLRDKFDLILVRPDQPISEHFGIQYIPTLMLFIGGQLVWGQIGGASEGGDMVTVLTSALAGISSAV
jgi:thioredoxin-like negative regulator of GroEL